MNLNKKLSSYAIRVVVTLWLTFAVLDVEAFERLLGPCMEIMKRNIDDYESQLEKIFGSKHNITDVRWNPTDKLYCSHSSFHQISVIIWNQFRVELITVTTRRLLPLCRPFRYIKADTAYGLSLLFQRKCFLFSDYVRAMSFVQLMQIVWNQSSMRRLKIVILTFVINQLELALHHKGNEIIRTCIYVK